MLGFDEPPLSVFSSDGDEFFCFCDDAFMVQSLSRERLYQDSPVHHNPEPKEDPITSEFDKTKSIITTDFT